MRKGGTNILDGSINKEWLIKLGLGTIGKYLGKVNKIKKSFGYFDNCYEGQVSLRFYILPSGQD